MLSGIIKIEVCVISPAEGRDIPDITKPNLIIVLLIHCLDENKDKHTVTRNRIDIVLEITHCAHNLKIGSQLSAGR